MNTEKAAWSPEWEAQRQAELNRKHQAMIAALRVQLAGIAPMKERT